MMTPERWQQVKELLGAALEMEPAQRSVYLEQACGEDLPLRDEIQRLLAAEESAGAGFLSDRTVLHAFDETVSIGENHRIGQPLGSYKLICLIGEGGMGAVYRAVRADDQYQSEVAIKLVHAGLDSPFIVSRFKNERQILASLDHPNIARLYDGGTTREGAPYFVMELVEGEPIDKHCDHHKLSIDARLKLFLELCSAVQYAHRRLIVHRDIKPNNILVTSEGIPKLLDFGIAKIVDQAMPTNVDQTAMSARVYTPAYASPEQVRGEPITTASDVYSLGVVLYELLTGHHPYTASTRTPETLSRAVCEHEPERLSTVVRHTEPAGRDQGGRVTPDSVSMARHSSPERLSKRLSGDLDNIVLMALRKEPDRRYESVDKLAEDVRRHLASLPVFARGEALGYRTWKFVNRHKAGVASAIVTSLALIVGTGVSVQQARIARAERARAERRFNDVRKLANSLLFEIHDSIRDLPGATNARELLVKRAVEYLDSLSSEANDPSLQRELAAAFDRIGDVQGYTGAANLDDFAGAARSYAKALAIRESLVAANPGDAGLRNDLANECFRVASAFENIGNFDDELRTLQRAQSILNGLSKGTDDQQRQYQMSGIYYYTARALEKTGDFSGALHNYQQAASTMEPLASAPQANPFNQAYLAADYLGIGKMLARVGRTGEAVALAAKGTDLLRKLVDGFPTNATLREYLAQSYDTSATILESRHDFEGAMSSLRRNHEMYSQIVKADPGNRMARTNLGWSDLSIAEILLRTGQIKAAMEDIRQGIDLFQNSDPDKGFWYANEMGQAYLDLGMGYSTLARRARSTADRTRLWREAQSCEQQALDFRSGIPNRLDANGDDQVSEITHQLAVTTAALERGSSTSP